MKINITITNDDDKVIKIKTIDFSNSKLESYLKNGDVDIAGIYYSTYKYGIFDSIQGNAEIDDTDLRRVEKGYEACEQLTNPIAVCHNFKIFDGEKRRAIYKNNGWSLEFTLIDENYRYTSVEDIIMINNARKNRDIHDWIHMYATTDNPNQYSYILLEKIDKLYQLPVSVIYAILKNVIHSGRLHSITNIKAGKCTLTQKEVDDAIPYLDFLMLNKKYFDSIRKEGNNETKFTLLIWCYRQSNVNKEEFMTKLRDYISRDKLSPITDIDKSLDELSVMYNYNKKKESTKVNFRKQYAEQSKNNLFTV